MKHLVALSILALTLAKPLYAQEPTPAPNVSLLSIQRVSVAAQVGFMYLDTGRGLTGIDPTAMARFVPAYAVWGKPGKSTGSVAFTFPFEMELKDSGRRNFGAFLSIVLWDGGD